MCAGAVVAAELLNTVGAPPLPRVAVQCGPVEIRCAQERAATMANCSRKLEHRAGPKATSGVDSTPAGVLLPPPPPSASPRHTYHSCQGYHETARLRCHPRCIHWLLTPACCFGRVPLQTGPPLLSHACVDAAASPVSAINPHICHCRIRKMHTKTDRRNASQRTMRPLRFAQRGLFDGGSAKPPSRFWRDQSSILFMQ